MYVFPFMRTRCILHNVPVCARPCHCNLLDVPSERAKLNVPKMLSYLVIVARQDVGAEYRHDMRLSVQLPRVPGVNSELHHRT